MAVALRKQVTILTLQSMFEAVEGCYTPKPKCALLEMVNDWEGLFANLDEENPISREVEQITRSNHQFKIQKNEFGHVTVKAKEFADTVLWESDDRHGNHIEGVQVLLRMPDQDGPFPCPLLPLKDPEMQALKNVVTVFEKHYRYVQHNTVSDIIMTENNSKPVYVSVTDLLRSHPS